MNETAILLASGPCLIAALGALSMILIGSNLGGRAFAYVWGIGFAASSLQWVLLTFNLRLLAPTGPSLIADFLGIVWAVALAQGFRLRNRGRRDDQAFLAAVVVAIVVLLFVTFGPVSPAARVAIVPIIKLGFMVWAMPKVFASPYRITTSEFAMVAILVIAAIGNIFISVVGFDHANSGGLGMIDAIVARAMSAGPSSAAIVLFSLLLIASDFSTARRRLVHTDPLTRLLNRSGFESETAAAIRRHRNLCVAMVDIDRFKAINDAHGHAIGDAVLAGFAVRLAAALRNDEIACRIGGEEFALVLASDTETAMRRIEALREGIMDLVIGALPELRFTASFGLARVARGEGLAGVVDRADKALYRSKNEGRNRTTLAEPIAP